MNVKFWDDMDDAEKPVADIIKKAASPIRFDQPLVKEDFENLRKQLEGQSIQIPTIYMWRSEWEYFVNLCKEAGIE